MIERTAFCTQINHHLAALGQYNASNWHAGNEPDGPKGDRLGDRWTKWNLYGWKAPITYLDRHKIECGSGEVLTQFKLHRKAGGSSIGYSYRCSRTAGSPSTCRDVSTKLQKVDNYDRHYVKHLSKHNINCEPTEHVNSFQMRVKEDHMQYEYRCCTTPSRRSASCREITTSKMISNCYTDGVYLLVGRNLACARGEYLSQFQTMGEGCRDILYRFRCCTDK